MPFFILLLILMLLLCCLPSIRARLKGRNRHSGLLIFIALLLLAVSFTTLSRHSDPKQADKQYQKTLSTTNAKDASVPSASFSSSSEAKSAKKTQSEKSARPFSAQTAADENHGFQGFPEKPLAFRHRRQMSLSNLDMLGRARDAHIQLQNSDEPRVKREPYLTYDPAGWHNYRFLYRNANGQTKKAWLMNRGHLVGYQFSGLNDEGRNLVAETAWLNTGNYVGTNRDNPDSMLYYEEGLDNWLSLHPDFYLDYQVTPLYQGNELLPRQVRLAYVGIDSQGQKIRIVLGSPKEETGNDGTTLVYLDNQSPNAAIDYLSGRAVNTISSSHRQAAAVSSSSQPAAAASQRIVYVTGDGRSPVYWYSEKTMPSNVNKARVKAMTEQQALDQGKHHSKTEP